VASWGIVALQLIFSGIPSMIKISMTVRLVRFLFTIIGSFKQFAGLFDSILDVLGLILTVLLSHIVWIYLFAIVGVELFGDVVR
jgi:hypothetical protein